MPLGYPPQPVYPAAIDSDYTLFLVRNTTEAKLSANNPPWAEEVSVEPRAASKPEVWPDNGFANISGELFYYDAVEKNGDNRVIKLKSCIRNLGGSKTKFNPSGTWVRGFVVAEHHTQLVDCAIAVEDFVGENFSDDEATLDYRVRNLAAQAPVFDDFNCPDINFSFVIVSEDPVQGTLARYSVSVTGNGKFQLQFGDGTSTSTATSGTHLYTPNANIDPVVVFTNDKCQIVQTPISRGSVSEPTAQATTPPFQIQIPATPTIPTLSIPALSIPSLDFFFPPIVFPCMNMSFGGFSVPSLIVVDPPLNVPSLIEFGPIAIPSLISIIGVAVPSVITFDNVPSFSPIPFDPFPDIPDIEFGPNPLPSNITFGPVTLPSQITFGPVTVPSLIGFGPNPLPTTINFGPVPVLSISIAFMPATIDFGPNPLPTTINFGPVNVPSTITFGPAPSFPTTISFGPAPTFPTTIDFGPAPFIPSLIEFGPEPFIPSRIEFGPNPLPTTINFGPVPVLSISIAFMPATIDFGPNPLPNPINFGPVDIPDTITFGPAPSFPTTINFGPVTIPDLILFGPAPFVPQHITFGPAPHLPSIINFAPIPSISVHWGTPPVISVVCPSPSPFAMAPPRRSAFAGGSQNLLPDPGFGNLEVQYDLVGFPSVINIAPPEIEPIKVQHDIPNVIRVESPKEIVLTQREPLPSEIRIVMPTREAFLSVFTFELPSVIRLDASDIPSSIAVEVKIPEDLPKFAIDASSIPDEIKVLGIPSVIRLDTPASIRLEIPEDVFVPMRYDGPPISVQINLGLDKLMEGDDALGCVRIVPCRRGV